MYTSKKFKELQVNKLERITPRHIIMKMLEDREYLENSKKEMTHHAQDYLNKISRNDSSQKGVK